MSSSYKASFVNWKNGSEDVFHEKHPQFPYYSLPFNGNSTYAQTFSDKQIEELRRQKKVLEAKGHKSEALKLGSYIP